MIVYDALAEAPLLRIQRVIQETGNCESLVRRNARLGLFTKPVKVGPRAAAWPAHEVRAIVAARVAGIPDAGIRELVCQLHASRLERAVEAVAAAGVSFDPAAHRVPGPRLMVGNAWSTAVG